MIEPTKKEVLDALRDLMALVDEGWLVRNTAGDGDPAWAIRQIPYLRRLAKIKEVLDTQTDEP